MPIIDRNDSLTWPIGWEPPKDEPAVVILGNLSDGFRIIGPFPNYDDACKFAEQVMDMTWIAKLEAPTK